MDTIIWLVDFPVRHGYAMVFIAGFSLMGLFVFAFRGARTATARLDAVREREGLPEVRRAGGIRAYAAAAQRILFRVLLVVMGAGLVLGILGLMGVPVTHGYIHDRGVPTTATTDGDWVTFSTPDGTTYTIENNFFTPAVYPDRGAWLPSDAPVVVRYLPSHPQAFVIDSSQITR